MTISVKFSLDVDGWPRYLRNIAENFNCLSRLHERYRQQTTNGRATANSKRECEFAFAKNRKRPCPSVCVTVSASINPLYPATDCAAATDISGVSGHWQLSR